MVVGECEQGVSRSGGGRDSRVKGKATEGGPGKKAHHTTRSYFPPKKENSAKPKKRKKENVFLGRENASNEKLVRKVS